MRRNSQARQSQASDCELAGAAINPILPLLAESLKPDDDAYDYWGMHEKMVIGMEEKHAVPQPSSEAEARRQFLERCGRFAVVTPPAMALLVTVAAKPDEAMASTFSGKDKDKDKDKDKHKPPGLSGVLDGILGD